MDHNTSPSSRRLLASSPGLPRLAFPAANWRVWTGWHAPAWRPAWERLFAWSTALTLIEWLVILAWTVNFTRPYLNLDLDAIPLGREYLSVIQAHHFWTRVQACGWCALWNGAALGGAPAVPDPFSSTFHPLVMLPALGWGVLNGSKLTLVAAFALAGFAQWWLGRVLGLGRIACVWSACVAVASGHLASRMDLGALGWVLSTGACALILPPLIWLARTASARAAVALGVVLALAAISGQAYLQAGVAFTAPAALLLVPRDRARWGLLVRRLLLAAGVAILLTAPFLVPFVHFLPAWVKESDPTFGSAPPFAYLPLNLVIDDAKFHDSDMLAKVPYPAINIIYVGWIPVLLALWGLHKGRGRAEWPALLYLAALAVLALWFASAAPLRWVTMNVPLPGFIEPFTRIRFPGSIAGLAIAPILGLAAAGLDSLLRAAWPKVVLSLNAGTGRAALSLALSAHWLLAIPIVWSMMDVRASSSRWIVMMPGSANMPLVLEALRTPDLQWVNVPVGEHYWTEPAQRAGLKLANGIEHFRLKDFPAPEAVREASDRGAPPGMEPYTVVNGMNVYAAGPGREYAAVAHDDGERTICTAQGLGGDVNVVCDLPGPGVLTVRENHLSGWQAAVDGQGTAVTGQHWLTLQVPAGQHAIQLRYRPWDVPLGLALMVTGILLVAYFWRRDDGGYREARS
jgi:hypothetical protein